MYIKGLCIFTDKDPKQTKTQKSRKKNPKYKTTTKIPKPNIRSLNWMSLIKVKPWKGQIHSPLIDVTNFHFYWSKGNQLCRQPTPRFGCPGKVPPTLNNLYFKDFHISYPRHHSTWIFPFLFAETHQIFKSHSTDRMIWRKRWLMRDQVVQGPALSTPNPSQHFVTINN